MLGKNGEKWGKIGKHVEKCRKNKNRKSEAAKARSGSRGPPAGTGNRKPEAAKARSEQARSGSRGPPAETGNRKPEILVSGFETGIWFRFWFGPCPERSPGHNWKVRVWTDTCVTIFVLFQDAIPLILHCRTMC